MKNIYLSIIPVSFQIVKRATMTLLFALFALTVHAQVGIGTITPDPSAQLDIQSGDKGLLIPRVTELTRTTVMLTPATGLLVYQSDGAAPGFYYYDGAAWQPLKTPSAAAGGGAIIPYASGLPTTMTTAAGGVVGTASILGFGSSAYGVAVLGGTIDATVFTNFAFSVPKNGTITAISAFFSNTIALNLLATTLTITAQVFSADPGSNTFAAVPGASVVLSPGMDGLVAIGQTSTETANGLSIPVVAGQRLLMVFSTTATGLSLVNAVSGYASAGLSIE